MGEQYGAAFSDDIRKYYEIYCLRSNKTPDKLDKSIPEYLERRCPYLLEEMEGVARGAGMRFEEILVFNHFNSIRGCTPMFFRDTEVGPILAQNIDCSTTEREALVMRVVRPDKGHAFISPVVVGTIWGGTAMNEAGVCKSGVGAATRHVGTKNGTGGGLIGRDVIQHAATAAEAIEMERSHVYVGKTGVGLYADRSGAAFLRERDGKATAVIPVEEFGFSTGLHESGKIESAGSPEYLQIKKDRKKSIQDLYEQGKIEFSVEGMKALLAHHNTPGPVCRHEPWQKAGVTETQASRILIPGRKRYLIALGPRPCEKEYQEYKL